MYLKIEDIYGVHQVDKTGHNFEERTKMDEKYQEMRKLAEHYLFVRMKS